MNSHPIEPGRGKTYRSWFPKTAYQIFLNTLAAVRRYSPTFILRIIDTATSLHQLLRIGRSRKLLPMWKTHFQTVRDVTQKKRHRFLRDVTVAFQDLLSKLETPIFQSKVWNYLVQLHFRLRNETFKSVVTYYQYDITSGRKGWQLFLAYDRQFAVSNVPFPVASESHPADWDQWETLFLTRRWQKDPARAVDLSLRIEASDSPIKERRRAIAVRDYPSRFAARP